MSEAKTPTRVAVVGACGKMGEQIRRQVAVHPDLVVSVGLEAPGHPDADTEIEPGVRVETDAKRAFEQADVAIDFTVPKATLANLHVAADVGLAYVTGTTGMRDDEKAEIKAVSMRIPVIHAPNFSPSVNILGWLAREAARRLGPDFDAELFELHHSAKRDAPSGTALFLAEAIAEGQDKQLADHLVLERAGETGARPRDAIGIQTLRGGDNPGEHTIYFVGQGERVELTHRAYTRDHFAKGAVRAAAWIVGQDAGLHPIERVFGLE
jgi:4-hydroxy-tetrahydrodipicolinate reductase